MDGMVNMDDLLTTRPGGVVRTKQPPSQVMQPLQAQGCEVWAPPPPTPPISPSSPLPSNLQFALTQCWQLTMGMRSISECWWWRWRDTGSAQRSWETSALQTPSAPSVRSVRAWPQYWRDVDRFFIAQIRKKDKCSTLEGLKLSMEQLHLHFFPQENYKGKNQLPCLQTNDFISP